MVAGFDLSSAAKNFAGHFESMCANVESHCLSSTCSSCSEDHFERQFRVPTAAFQKAHKEIITESIFVHRRDAVEEKRAHSLV